CRARRSASSPSPINEPKLRPFDFMKKFIPAITSLFALIVALPAARAADESKPAPQDDKKELRVIVSSDHEAPRAGVKVIPRVFGRSASGEKEMVTFLGVETSPVSPTLSAQLGLPEGSGLVVNHLTPNGPALSVL